MIDFSDLAASRSLAVAEAVGRLALRSGSALRPYSTHPLRRWAAVAAFVAISGCSTFGGSDVQEPSKEAAAASSDATAKKATATATTDGTTPDINSVPTSVPQPQDVSIDGVQSGLGADTSNAQYTETLTPPTQSVARPAAPEPEPEQPAAATQAAAVPAPAAPAPAGIPAPQAPAVAQAPLAAPVGQIQAPQLNQSGQLEQGFAGQGYAGTPQPGSKPYGNTSGGYAPAVGTQSAPQVAANGVTVDYSSVAAGGSYGYASYGAYQRQNPAQSLYRSPYGATQPMAYQSVYAQPGAYAASSPVPGALPYAYGYGYQPVSFQSYGQPAAVPPLPPAGQPIGVVYFNNGSARLSSDDRKVVKQVADMQRYYGGVIRVVGHASMRTGNMDPFAQGQVNYEVSADRANSIARAFTQIGVPAGLVQVAAAGAANPVSTETMPAGEANNRRVEIFLSAY